MDGASIGRCYKEELRKRMEVAKSENCQAKLVATRRNDNDLEDDRFEWLAAWRSVPSSTIASAQILYKQLLPTTVYQQRRPGLNPSPDVTCRMCSKSQESTSHVLACCSALVQTKYLARHNSMLKILFFELQKTRFDWHPSPHGFLLLKQNQYTKKSALKVIGMCKFMPRTLKSKQTEKMQGHKNSHIQYC